MRRWILFAVVLVAVLPASATAQSGGGALTQLPAAPKVGTPRVVAVSPDGDAVVVGSGSYTDGDQRGLTHAGLTVLTRDLTTGVVTPSACADETGSTTVVTGLTCTRVPELGVVYAVAVAPATAPGGPRIYALATGPRSGPRLFEFTRNAATGGALVAAARPLRVDVVTSSGGTLALGPGGDTLYVGGDRGLRLFQRYGQPGLAPLAGKDGCITATGRVTRTGAIQCRVGRAVGEVNAIAIAPGGAALWLASYREKPNGQFGSNGILSFSRNKPGTLAQRPGKKGCAVDTAGDRALSPGCTRTRGLRTVTTLSPVGETAVVAHGSDGLLTFTRTGFTPDLTLRTRSRVTGPAALVSADGRNAYSFPGRDGLPPIATYTRVDSGRLTPQAPPATHDLDGATTGALSPDGRSLYVVSPKTGALAAFSRSP